MKKINIVVRFLMLFAMITTFAGCVSTGTHESTTGEYIEDSVITTKVKSLLSADDFLKSFDINVGTYQGSVQLSGFVDSKKTFTRAAEVAMGVKGVKSINNDLIVK